MKEKKCSTLFWVVGRDEGRCGRRATHLLDGKNPLCEKCAQNAHPKRVTPIQNHGEEHRD